VVPAAEFRRCYNRRSFLFRHGLQGHPHFQLPSLLALARRQSERPGLAYCSNGAVEIADRWEKGVGCESPVETTLAGIACNDSLVMLKHVEQDAVLGPMLRQLLARMIGLSGCEMRDDVIVGRATILVASPRRITAYHLDADTNFLFQVHGSKSFSVFDQTDRTMLTDVELENYHAGDANGAVFKTSRQDEALTYALDAGLGVHVPSTAPHWARNGDNVSVALSLNYDLRSVRRRGRIYAMNRRLRRLGIDPSAPGRSAWRDRIKLAAVDMLGAARRMAGRNRDDADPSGWTPGAYM
jgi:hypothetical protein